LLFLDEPLGGLNPVETQDAIRLISDLRDRGITIVFIEHIIKAVTALSDRIMVLAQGQKLAEGKPADILANEEVRRAYLGDVEGALKRRRRPQPSRGAQVGAIS
jgi:ABC-type branched-subunit amino acid transport system ATPase component